MDRPDYRLLIQQLPTDRLQLLSTEIIKELTRRNEELIRCNESLVARSQQISSSSSSRNSESMPLSIISSESTASEHSDSSSSYNSIGSVNHSDSSSRRNSSKGNSTKGSRISQAGVQKPASYDIQKPASYDMQINEIKDNKLSIKMTNIIKWADPINAMFFKYGPCEINSRQKDEIIIKFINRSDLNRVLANQDLSATMAEIIGTTNA